jgi:antitoxin ChpS
MELIFKKLGNSTGLTFPASFLREHHLRDGQAVVVDAKADGTIILIPKVPRKRYTAAELNAQCDLKAPMPTDLHEWDKAPGVGSEAL